MRTTNLPGLSLLAAVLCAGCSQPTEPMGVDGGTSPQLPLIQVADYPLPGRATRFDYQDLDRARRRLVVAHMNDAAVVVVDLRDGSVQKEIPGIPTARGVVVADEVSTIFVTSSPDQLVLIDAQTLAETARVQTGSAPDGVAWDPLDRVVGVSDQGDGALSLIAEAGKGTRTAVPLGVETGNVAFDAARGWFWITVVSASPPDQLVAVDPKTAAVMTKIGLPGCEGAHGLRLHPDGASALIACEGNDALARVELTGEHPITLADTGAGPDVLSIDPALGWLYVAAESGDLKIFDLGRPGLETLGGDHPGDHAHSVAVDPETHHVFFPLMIGDGGTPVLRVMRPTF